MSEQIEKTEDSVAPAPVRFRLGVDNLVPESVRVKCSHCKALRTCEWIKVQPVPVDEPDESPEGLLEIMSRAKRVVMCQTCGNISVTK